MSTYRLVIPTDGYTRIPSTVQVLFEQVVFIPVDDARRVHVMLHWDGEPIHSPYVHAAYLEVFDTEYGWQETAGRVSLLAEVV